MVEVRVKLELPTSEVREFFHKRKDGTGALWIPTATRNAIIAEEGYSATPKMTVAGRIYAVTFKSIGGGMWETKLRSIYWNQEGAEE